ncbi:MAG: GTPase ObgE [Chloroflexi bacterium]|nr:GTPase ObgE [Chloroflexota bacterium]
MIDQAVIHILSGTGGNGAISGRHEKFVPRGGPDGGNGGDGGSVYVIGDVNVNTLLSFHYNRRFTATNGSKGAGALRHGKDGFDVDIVVPIGTQVWIEEDPPRLLVDVETPGERVLVAQGGRGGGGNARLATSTNRFPVLASAGERGQAMTLRLELKLIADVGIIGVPNAGKSSLITTVSAARPKIAEYPFTTLEPVLGVVGHRRESFVMVDIPGLIEGASDGIGLGHDFLRHIERTRVLVHIVDGSAIDPVADYLQTNQELHLFNEDLLNKPQIIALNKIDIPEVRELMDHFAAELDVEDAPLFFISAISHEGVDELLDQVIQTLDDAKHPRSATLPFSSADDEQKEVPILRPTPRRQRPTVFIDGDTYVVDAPEAARIAALIDDRDWAARMQFYRHLRRQGIVKMLEDAGRGPGDNVRIGEVEWEWE